LVACEWYCNDTFVVVPKSYGISQCMLQYCLLWQTTIDAFQSIVTRKFASCTPISFDICILIYCCNIDTIELKKTFQSSTNIYEINPSITRKLCLSQNSYVCNNKNIFSNYKSWTMFAIKTEIVLHSLEVVLHLFISWCSVSTCSQTYSIVL
jgi:hypothetical protein